MRLVFGVLIFIAALLEGGLAQTQRPAPGSEIYVPTMKFDVASIRESGPVESYSMTGGWTSHSSHLRVTNFQMSSLLMMAYRVRPDQIVGLPDWRKGVFEALFTITASSDEETDARLAQLKPWQVALEQQHMIQVLLAERFGLKVHWEMREGPAFHLVVLKHGPKLTAATGLVSPEEQQEFGDRPVPTLYQRGNGAYGSGYVFIAHGCSMTELADTLAGQFGRVVLDQTGLPGRYDFQLRYRGRWAGDYGVDEMDTVRPLDRALEDELGLKVESAKEPERVLVIDHVEKPSAN